MSDDWKLIARGFVVAGIGAWATIFYIISVSAAFIGRYTTATLAMVTAGLLSYAFLRLVTKYLDAIDDRQTRGAQPSNPAVDGFADES
jgi:hypothetical protein